MTSSPPRILVIGAGSRGNAYARAIKQSTYGIVAAVADPIEFKRKDLGRKYIWGDDGHPEPEQEFTDWRMWIKYEQVRREREAAGEKVEPGVDAALVCTLDEQHKEIVTALAPLKLRGIMCEKPLATTLSDCLDIYNAVQPVSDSGVFGIGHVLRYSPHNNVLRNLIREENKIGDIISIEHTEPVGWWHFSHSYVRGNWRKESTTAPSLLTKSCHDIDIILWLLGYSANLETVRTNHLPRYISSSGSLTQFKKSRKPGAAGSATNCLSCSYEPDCQYSAKKIYLEKHLQKGRTDWPVKIVNPEIEDCFTTQGVSAASDILLQSLAEDYDKNTPQSKIDSRGWYGRCVWESDNDVCDDQTVTLTWEDESEPDGKHVSNGYNPELRHRGEKSAIFHMIAPTQAQCERRGRIYGTKGEISYDSFTIEVYDFASGEKSTYKPKQMGGGHGGGDDGLARQFVLAVDAVKNRSMTSDQAQRKYIGCTLEDVLTSHAMVFAAEDARKERKVVDWKEWWQTHVKKHSSQGA